MSIKEKILQRNKQRLSADNVYSIPIDQDLLNIKPLNYEQMINDKPIPFENVLTPIIPDPGFVFIYAATGVGKTMFTLNLAYSIASGKNFLKYKVNKARSVLYIDGEMKYQQMHARFLSIVKQQGKLENLNYWNLYTPDKFLPFRLPKICDPQGQAFYNQKIDELNIKVLILDNLSTLSAIDENNSEQWKMIQDWIIHLRAKNITVILIHHSGKNKEYRGTSRMIDCVDTVISLEQIDDNLPEADKNDIKKLKVVYKKNRTFDGQDSLPFEVTFSAAGWNFESLEKTNKTRITQMLDDGMKAPAIAKDLNMSESYVYRIKRQIRPSS